MLFLREMRDSGQVASGLRAQWINPSNILDLLLLVGGDLITVALAQLTGSHWYWPTPVVFSFGWVAYAFKQTTLVFGHNRLLIPTDVPSLAINGRSGYHRTNSSWILGRLLRDYENGSWGAPQVHKDLHEMLKGEGKPKSGLCISLFNATSDKPIPAAPNELEKGGEPATEPKLDWWWISSYIVAFMQFGIAAIPWGIWGEWEIFMVTAFGTLLSFSAGSFQQWRRERWSCRRVNEKGGTYILTRGNGAQHALLIVAKQGSLNLEDLAASTEEIQLSISARVMALIQLVLWIALLVTVDGLENHTWFLIAVGALGMFQTALVSAAPRTPESWGIKLEPMLDSTTKKPYIMDAKVMPALFELEKAYPGVGLAALPIFFPGSKSPSEEAFWDQARAYLKVKHPNMGSSKVNQQALSGKTMLEEQMAEEKKRKEKKP